MPFGIIEEEYANTHDYSDGMDSYCRITKAPSDSDVRVYAFTYNKNYSRDAVQNREDYTPVLDLLNKRGIVKSYVFEVGGKQNRLHIHGIVEMSKKFCYPNYLKLPNMIYKVDEIHTYEAWSNYLVKSQYYF